MTTADAVLLPPDATVRHKSGKLYRVLDVRAQVVCSQPVPGTLHWQRAITSNPRPARLLVVGQRNGSDFGPIRSIAAAACEVVAR